MKKYETPIQEIIDFLGEDIITTSMGEIDTPDPGEDDF